MGIIIKPQDLFKDEPRLHRVLCNRLDSNYEYHETIRWLNKPEQREKILQEVNGVFPKSKLHSIREIQSYTRDDELWLVLLQDGETRGNALHEMML